MPVLVPANTSVATQRHAYFDLRLTDGISPALAEAGGQPQLSVDGAGWTSTGISTLTSMGFGRYYATISQSTIASSCRVETRYASGNTCECPGDSFQVIGPNIYDGTALGLANLDTNVGSRLAPTVAGHTLAVNSTGQAGVDWGNVANQTTTVNLANTTTLLVQSVAAVGDKTGYSLGASQTFSTTGSVGSITGVAFPAHFGSLAIDSGSGGVTVYANSDKTGYALSASGLAAISVADPGGIAGMTTIPAMIVALWRRSYKQTTLTSTQLCCYANDGVTVNTTQAVSDNSIVQVCQAAV